MGYWKMELTPVPHLNPILTLDTLLDGGKAARFLFGSSQKLPKVALIKNSPVELGLSFHWPQLDESSEEIHRNAAEIRNALRQLGALEQLQKEGVELATRTGGSAAVHQQVVSLVDNGRRPAHLPRRRRGSRNSPAEWRGSCVFDLQKNIPPVTRDKTMDPAQTKNRNALQGVLSMLKGAQSPAQVAKVISLALQTDSLYTFSEVGALPSVKALEGTEHEAWLEILQIFQHGTYRDYDQKASKLNAVGVTLDARQCTKLRVLTFIVLGSNPPITYDAAISALGIVETKEDNEILQMSRFFMLAVDEGLINGRLDSQSRKIHIDEISPLRDVSFSEYADMYATLDSWMNRTEEQLKIAEDRARSIRHSAESRRADEDEFESRREAAELEASKGRKRGGGAGGDGGDDEPSGSSSGARNTRAR